jgi:exodeoxyribonuclease VII large subunit
MRGVSTLDLFDQVDRASEDEPERPPILRVAEINRAVRQRLESDYRDVWIEGELSDVTRASSGHVYFTLNDEREPAQLRGVMFRGDARRAKARLERGAVVRMKGQLTLYEARGSYQLVARLAIPAGAGDLHAQFERIRKKLDAEGLFSDARKRALPRFPEVVGVVTSASGAALHDIVRVASLRCPVRIVVADCRVQGQEAPASIVRALADVQRLPDLDVVIVGRGGGSAEDLWAFNYESVARAIALCRVPVVSAVGHEVDVTIADLVADVRASTPSNAAELVVPDRRTLQHEIDAGERRLARALDGHIAAHRLRLERLGRDLGDPRHRLSGGRRAIERGTAGLIAAMRHRIAEGRKAVLGAEARARQRDPRARIARSRRLHAELDARLRAAIVPLVGERRTAVGRLDGRLVRAMEVGTDARRSLLSRRAAQLDALSPLAVLSRGYAIALHGEGDDKKALTRASDATPGDVVSVVLHEGHLSARIESVTPVVAKEHDG